jgi:hypothetical protein
MSLLIPQILLAIPGCIALSLVATRAWPSELTNRVVPALLVVMALACVFLPIRVEAAVSVMPIAALLAARFSFAFTGHEAADYSKVTAPVVSATGKVKARVKDRFWPEPEAEVTEILQHGYPNPAEQSDGDENVADLNDSQDAELTEDAGDTEDSPVPAVGDSPAERAKSLQNAASSALQNARNLTGLPDGDKAKRWIPEL